MPPGPTPGQRTIATVSANHYENFPVASVLCPPALRRPVTAIYRFARTADDLADEGDDAPELRRARLAHFRAALSEAVRQKPLADAWPAVFVPLAQEIGRHALPVPLLEDLLDAFEQDTRNPRYADRLHLMDYCRRSANPIGRLVLHLAGIRDAQSLQQSDAICSALQLINFWQDASVDLPRGRHYVPASDARRHGLTLDQLAAADDSAASQALMRDLCQWARTLMMRGAPLALRVPGRLGWELRLVVQGGLCILQKIEQMDYRTLHQRPRLRAFDWPGLLWRALRMPRQLPARRAAWR